MALTLITDIGEFFTGDIAGPTASVSSLLIEDGCIAALNPSPDVVRPDAATVINASGAAVMPGLVDGHIHPTFGEWTPAQNAVGWIGNYLIIPK